MGRGCRGDSNQRATFVDDNGAWAQPDIAEDGTRSDKDIPWPRDQDGQTRKATRAVSNLRQTLLRAISCDSGRRRRVLDSRFSPVSATSRLATRTSPTWHHIPAVDIARSKPLISTNALCHNRLNPPACFFLGFQFLPVPFKTPCSARPSPASASPAFVTERQHR